MNYALVEELADQVLTITEGNYYERRLDAQARLRSPGQAARSVTPANRAVKAGGSQVGSVSGPGPLFFLAPHPKGEVTGAGAGPELGKLGFELGHFGLESLCGRSLSLELVNFPAQSGQLA
jgi:hypothetical protein